MSLSLLTLRILRGARWVWDLQKREGSCHFITILIVFHFYFILVHVILVLTYILTS